MTTHPRRLAGTLGELRRRHVFRVVGAYGISVWLVIEVADVVLPALLAPSWVLSVVVLFAILGLPVAAFLAWVYDITPQGVVRTAPATPEQAAWFRWNWRWLDYLIIAGLVAILVFILARSPEGPVDLSPGRSIAVLPFSDLSPGHDTGYFGDGMAEAILDSLARIPGIQVAARTSSFSFRDRDIDVRELAETLGVSVVLEGSVRKAGERLRISTRLVDGRTGHHLWNETYDGSLEDVFAVQDSISRSIVDVLQVQLLGNGILVAPATTSQVAYDIYLRGRNSLRQEGSLENLEEAIGFFERALEQDPAFGLARAGLCTAHMQKYDTTREPRHFERAQATCEQARLQDPDRAETQVALGNIYLGTGQTELALEAFGQALERERDNSEAHVGMSRAREALGDFESAERHLHRAIELDPAYWGNHSHLGVLYYAMGNFPAAAEQFRQAIRLEPASPRSYSNLGGILYLMGEFDQAAEAHRQSIQREPTAIGFSNAGISYFNGRRFEEAEVMFRVASEYNPADFRYRGFLAEALLNQPGKQAEAMKSIGEALRLARQRLEINPDDHECRASMALYLAELGRNEEARTELTRLQTSEALNALVHRNMARAWLALEDPRQVLVHLEGALGGGYPRVLLASEPWLDPLRTEPRFAALLDTVQ